MGDEPAVFQFARAERHAEVAHQLLTEGKAYRCYTTSEELEQMREQQRAATQPIRYDRRWRARDATEAVDGEIGRGPGGERVGQPVWLTGSAVDVKEKQIQQTAPYS